MANQAKLLRSQLKNVVKDQLGDVLTNELVAKAAEQIEQRLREVFGARLESINESILSQLKSMDDRAKDIQQFMLNQVTAELGRKAPNVEVPKDAPESATLTPAE